MKNYGNYYAVIMALVVLGGLSTTTQCYWYNLINGTPFEVVATVSTDKAGKTGNLSVTIPPHGITRVGDGSGLLLRTVRADVRQSYIASEANGNILEPEMRKDYHSAPVNFTAQPYDASSGGLAGSHDFLIAGPFYNKYAPEGFAGTVAGLREPYYIVTRTIN